MPAGSKISSKNRSVHGLPVEPSAFRLGAVSFLFVAMWWSGGGGGGAGGAGGGAGGGGGGVVGLALIRRLRRPIRRRRLVTAVTRRGVLGLVPVRQPPGRQRRGNGNGVRGDRCNGVGAGNARHARLYFAFLTRNKVCCWGGGLVPFGGAPIDAVGLASRCERRRRVVDPDRHPLMNENVLEAIVVRAVAWIACAEVRRVRREGDGANVRHRGLVARRVTDLLDRVVCRDLPANLELSVDFVHVAHAVGVGGTQRSVGGVGDVPAVRRNRGGVSVAVVCAAAV